MRTGSIRLLAGVATLAVACSQGGGGDATDAAVETGDLAEVADVPAEADVPVETADVTGDEAAGDALDGEAMDDLVETVEAFEAEEPVEAIDDAPDAADVPAELPPLALKPPLATPADPLKDTGIESCSVFQAEECKSGKLRRCHVYDTKTKAYVAEPDPMLERVLLLERWRDLYNKPDGMTSERNSNVATLPGTPEAVWSDPTRFSSHDGMGDSGIWTGWTVVGDILRYSQTGTEADYKRMEDGVRTLLTMYDVTGVPGYFIRYFFLLLPQGAPRDPAHVFRYEGQVSLDHHDRPVDAAALAELPDVYTDGVTDGEGNVWKGTPMWHGRPSIDQNTGPMNALPMAYAMLKDEALKQRIAHHLTCYLNRLQRIELRHLQENPDLAKSLMQFFNAGELMLDPGDIDLTKLDTIVGYVQRQINTANEATFDKSCPDHPQMEPWRVVDATGETFLGDLLDFVNDMDTSAGGPNQIDHYYFPNLRGGDAVHLIHLAAMAYWFTGDEVYRKFLFEELIGNLQAVKVAHTAGAFDQDKFCSHFFGDQLTYGSWWVLLGMLEDSDLKTELQKAFHAEMWDKLLKQKGNADFYLMYAGEVPDAIATGKQQALAYAMDALDVFGGNGWDGETQVLDDPRRSYTLTPEFVMAHAPDGITADCPTQKQYELCTAEIDFMGIKIPGQNLLEYVTCNEADPWQCKVPNGKCVDKLASGPLPVNLRQHTDWLWQRNPYELRKGVGIEGGVQYPSNDVSEPYWNARRYGFITEGAGQVLAWEDSGDCPD
jgi:hypothetical protein